MATPAFRMDTSLDESALGHSAASTVSVSQAQVRMDATCSCMLHLRQARLMHVVHALSTPLSVCLSVSLCVCSRVCA